MIIFAKISITMLGTILGILYTIGIISVIAYAVWPEWFRKHES